MIQTVLTMLIDAGSIMVILLLLRYVFGAKLNLNLKKMALLALSYVVLGTIIFYLFGSTGTFLAVIFFIVGVFFIFGKEGPFKIYLYLIPALLTYTHWTQYLMLWERLFGIPDALHLWGDIGLIVILVIWAIQVEKKRLEFSMGFWECVFIAFFGLISGFYVNVCDMIEQYNTGWGVKLLYKGSWLFFVTVVDVCLILAIAYRKKSAYEKKISRIYEHYFEEEYRTEQERKEHKRELDHLRHDWKNHVNTVQAMWERGETNQAVEYVAALAEDTKTDTYTIFSGNEVADAILNLKEEKAREAGIVFSFKGSLNRLARIESVDICVLLGNALDNALEACKKGKDGSILISASENAGFVLLTIENTIFEPVVLKDNRPVTSKKNASQHGFGVLGMEHVVRKYQGDMRFEIGDETCKVQVMLPVPECK